MTDDEIIKALMHCKAGSVCMDCPLFEQKSATCISQLNVATIDLIKRQQAKIEELSGVLSDSSINCAEIKAKAIKEFAEKLFQKFAGHSYYHGDVVLTIIICLAEGQEVKSAEPINICDIKTEAIARFAERLKAKIAGLEVKSPNETYKCGMEDVLYHRMPKIIDQLVKEMTAG